MSICNLKTEYKPAETFEKCFRINIITFITSFLRKYSKNYIAFLSMSRHLHNCILRLYCVYNCTTPLVINYSCILKKMSKYVGY